MSDEEREVWVQLALLREELEVGFLTLSETCTRTGAEGKYCTDQ